MKTKQLEEAVTNAGNFFQEQYIDYMNSYLTIAKFALDKNLTEKQARQQIEIGRKIHHQRTSKNCYSAPSGHQPTMKAQPTRK